MSEMNEYSALHNGALFFDRSDRTRLRISGPKAAELVTGMVTNDVSSLVVGEGQYAAALCDIGVFGRSSRSIVARATGIDDRELSALAPYSHITAPFGDSTITVARVPEMDLDGFEIFVPSESVGTLKNKLHAGGVSPGSAATWQIARVESGRPQWGADMDDSTLPQEANFDELGAISYTKGCYIGQETVARVHFRGHVNRFLRKLRFVTRPAPPTGAELVDETGKVIGDIRSVALSPRYGGVALAMVRREVQPGTTLQARWSGGECSVQIEQNEKSAAV